MRGFSRRARAAVVAGAVCAALGAGTAVAAESTTPPGFKQDVLPVLNQHCGECHAPGHVGYQAINLDLTNYRGVMNGSTHGQVVIPRQPEMSPLVKVLDWSKDKYPHMPANQHELAKQDVNTISAWIAAGAKDN